MHIPSFQNPWSPEAGPSAALPAGLSGAFIIHGMHKADCRLPLALQGVIDVPIYGRIASLQLFRPKDAAKDLIFLLTEKYKFCVLEYNQQVLLLAKTFPSHFWIPQSRCS